MTKTKNAGILARTLGVLAVAALAAVPLTAVAQHGGGGHGGGGGGHMGGGGGGHMGGGGHAAAAGGHFSGGGGRFAGGGARFSGGHASVGAHGFYGSHAHFAASGGGHFYGSPGARAGVGHGYNGHGGFGRPGFVGGSGRHWGGGYWGGRFWPGVRYGAGFAWFLPILPFGYATYYWGGLPYYYYDNAYYQWDSGYNGYVATDPPPVGDSDSSGDTSANNVESNDAESNGAAPGGSADLFVYPRNGQSDEQTATDKFECHKWAVSQSGFDPTHSSNPPDSAPNYQRAIAACLDARGYSAK